ncbi:acyl-CoA reductase-like NAD-dependent aldehyde dehydrogenase [Rhizobium sp. BK650]|uniref:aldehyde dehydrogenase family protein n=1 Tax=Rhizobium sp. BK650 TaxID=2586990 RepID=UPI00161D6423|nr:aldehyde dehydrogenase family protein [Rhizobium sp. BK650]MBB3660116.1 acyl-CoA reductase-like NAD-dependent aldehyde dehydrogenase [Rhizobium sp. BK650]
MEGIASTALKNLQRPDFIEHRAFLDGTWAARTKTLNVTDPATGEHLIGVAACSIEDADAAVEAAKNAFVDWRDRVPVERGRILRAWGKLRSC